MICTMQTPKKIWLPLPLPLPLPLSAGVHSGPIPEWTIREQLILASAVQRSGDQNWCVFNPSL